jgi:hypothetical protein
MKSYPGSFFIVSLALLIVFLPFSGCGTPGSASGNEENITVQSSPEIHRFADAITEDFMREHLFVLAGDSLQGRGTGQKGIDMTADYIKAFYQDHGILPLGDDGSYFQNFHLTSERIDTVVYRVLNSENPSDEPLVQEVFALNMPGRISRMSGGTNDFIGEVYFAGFGVLDQQRQVDHLGDADLSDKWVLIIGDIPHIVDGDTLIDPGFGTTARTRELLFRRGAAGVLVITTTDEHEYEIHSHNYTRLMSIPFGFSLPGGTPRVRFQPNIASVSPGVAEMMLGLNAEGGGLSALIADLTHDPAGFRPMILPIQVESKVTGGMVDTPVSNIVGLIEGSDPELKNEYVIISAHHDHLGFGNPDSSGDFIYNGADDNGSGTVNLLALAKAFSEAREAGFAPKRSIILLHVTAEEVGLLGSRYYSDNPTVPIGQIVANINTDMIGRVDDDHLARDVRDYVYIIGAEIISSDMNNRLFEASQIRGNPLDLNMRFNDLDDRNQFYRRSDHWNFGRLGIPFIFFFSGVHADYHQPSDTPDKIDYDVYTLRSQLIFSTTVQIADHTDRPVVDSEEFIRRTRANPR